MAVHVYFRKRCEKAEVRCQPSLFYQVHTSVELCHACAYFKHNWEHSMESCNNRYTGKLQKKKKKSNLLHFKVYEFETSAKMVVCQWNDNHDKFHHPLLSLLSFKEFDDQNLRK